MFDIGWGELVVIGVVALVAIGPKELPGVLRAIGQWTGKIRRMAGEFQGQFQEAMREAEMADVKKQVDQISSGVKDYAQFDPFAETQKQIDEAWKNTPGDKTSGTSADAKHPEMPAAHIPQETVQNPPIDVPLPEQLPSPTEKDFTAAQPAAQSAAAVDTPNNAGGGKAA